jgi:hypothetical protein
MQNVCIGLYANPRAKQKQFQQKETQNTVILYGLAYVSLVRVCNCTCVRVEGSGKGIRSLLCVHPIKLGVHENIAQFRYSKYKYKIHISLLMKPPIVI